MCQRRRDYCLSFVDGRTISVPLAWSWRLLEATPKQRSKFEIIGDGYSAHWPDIDEDISSEGMLYGIPARRSKHGHLHVWGQNWGQTLKAELTLFNSFMFAHLAAYTNYHNIFSYSVKLILLSRSGIIPLFHI